MLFGLTFRIRLLQLCRNDTGTFPEINRNRVNSWKFSYALKGKQLPSSAVTRSEEFLTEFIKAHGLSWAEFSRIINYSDRMVRKWVRSEELSANAAAAISDGFIIPLNLIMKAAAGHARLPAQFMDRVAWRSRLDQKNQQSKKGDPFEPAPPQSDASKLLGRAAAALAQNNPVDIGSIVSQIDVNGMSRVDLARRAVEILRRLRDTADTEQAKQRFRGAILSCERIIQSNENQRKKQEHKAKGA